MCVRELCARQLCVRELCVRELCVRELCVRELCARELCVSKLRRKARQGDGRERTKKQEPHTKMWGKKSSGRCG